MLTGRRIVLGVSGGVAAYKAAYLARRLVENGAMVRSAMTESAAQFLGAQTLAALTGEHPVENFWDEADVSPHTELGRWAEAIVIAPATAATIARLATGLSDNVLIATALASEAPILVAPAMHTEMWQNAATQRNIKTLQDDGVSFVGPLRGALAGGDSGPGRMAEPEDIVSALVSILTASPAAQQWSDLSSYSVLVTAGGTREPIDPVRYIGNRSSGKMGNAIAVEAARRGAEVTLVTAGEAPDNAGIKVISVETAQEMADAAWGCAGDADIAVMAAAVADFRPKTSEESKLRRGDGLPTIDVEPTPDILAGIAGMENRPYLVGFAAETGSLEGALRKATQKGVDLLVGNDVTRPGSGFGTDTNEVTIYTPSGATETWPLLSKREVARRLWDRILEEHAPG